MCVVLLSSAMAIAMIFPLPFPPLVVQYAVCRTSRGTPFAPFNLYNSFLPHDTNFRMIPTIIPTNSRRTPPEAHLLLLTIVGEQTRSCASLDYQLF